MSVMATKYLEDTIKDETVPDGLRIEAAGWLAVATAVGRAAGELQLIRHRLATSPGPQLEPDADADAARRGYPEGSDLPW